MTTLTGLDLVLPLLLKGGALLLLVLAVVRLLDQASSATRHLVLVGGLLTLLALPVLEVALPWRIGLLPDVTPTPGARSADAAEAAQPGPSDRTAEPGATDAAGAGDLDGLGLLGLIWFAGAAVSGVRLARAWIRMAGVVRRGRRLDDPEWAASLALATERIRPGRSVAVIESGEVSVPMTTGWLRPVVHLPTSARSWSPARRTTVLMHELVHVRQWDLPLHTLAQLACALHWPNPLVWIASRWARAECEQACDDRVLDTGVRPSQYATELLDIARATGGLLVPAAALPLAAADELESRLTAILEPLRSRGRPSRRLRAVIVAGLVAAAVPIAGHGLRAAASPPADAAAGPRESLVGVLGDHADPRVRARAAWSLGERGERDALIPLMDAVGDPDAEVRTMAVWALMELADPASLPAIVRALGDDAPRVRLLAARAIGELDLEGVPEALLDAASDPDPEVARMAVWALGELR